MDIITYRLIILSIKKKIFDEFVRKIHVISDEGGLEIYPQHISLLTIIKPSTIHITKKCGDNKLIYLYGGILEVKLNNVIILADTVINDS
ncbi:MAG: hypothetical protein ArsCj_1000 [Arsenophonus endosymbiont of Ceratovacuna japonica]